MKYGVRSTLRAAYRYICVNRLPALRHLLDDTSEHGELLFLRSRLKREPSKLVVDVGANDGFTVSNSYPLIRTGWKAVLIEPLPRCFDKLTARYAGNEAVQLVNAGCGEKEGKAEIYLGKDHEAGLYATLSQDDNEWFRQSRTTEKITVDIRSLTRVLDECRIPAAFGLLSVDTEGFDLTVLKSLDFSRYRPSTILTEDDPILLPPPPEQQTDAAKYAYLESVDYRKVRSFGRNSIWFSTRAG